MRQLGRRSVDSFGHTQREEKWRLRPGRIVSAEPSAQRGPPAVPGPVDRTAGGIGGAAPASLDLYGQSRTSLLIWFSEEQTFLLRSWSWVEGLGNSDRLNL